MSKVRKGSIKNRIGQHLTIGKSTYEIVHTLGSGFDGEVHLIRTSEGLRVAKIFRSEGILRDRLSEMGTMLKTIDGRPNVSIPKIIDVDVTHNIVIMEYIEGVPLDVIRSYPNVIGITRERAMEIVNDMPLGVAAPANMLFSFKDGKYYVIDSI